MYGFANSDRFTDKQKKTLRFWYAMSPKDRDYDRLVARQIPYGAYWALETKDAIEAEKQMDRDYEDGEGCCSCHIDPPCSYCVDGGGED